MPTRSPDAISGRCEPRSASGLQLRALTQRGLTLLVAFALLAGCAGLRFDNGGYSAEGKASYYGARHHGSPQPAIRQTGPGDQLAQ
jgi:hypothetical protein